MSSLNKRIPWPRYWSPIDIPIHVEDGAGFLSDPENEYARYYNPNCLRIDELLGRRCLILCGEPGMGKTTAIEELIKAHTGRNAEPKQSLLHVAWESCSNIEDFDHKTIRSTTWRRWLKSDSDLMLIVDGVDESFWVVRNFVDRLRDRLSEQVPLHRLRLILACRRLEWPQIEGQALIDLWPSGDTHDTKGRGPVFELCPLTRSAVRLAAEARNISSDQFFQAISERQVQALAARPVTLFMLLSEFKESGEQFSATHRELYQQACLKMCEEPDLKRMRRRARPSSGQDPWPARRLLAVASRIAALSFLTGKPIIRNEDLGEPSTDTELTLNDICIGQEQDAGGGFELDQRLVDATLATTLFAGKGPGRCGFQHPTYGECLAGRWLSRLPLTQLRLLLCGRDELGEYVRPQLAEVVAWTAAEREDFFDHILMCDPGVLLRSDISHLDNKRKAKLIDCLLEKTARAEHTTHNDRRVFYSALAHPGLAQQLRPWLLDSTRVVPARWLALDIANACHCRALFKVLFILLRRQDDPITRQAGYALDDLVDPNLADALIPIVTGRFDPPQPRHIRRVALRTLVQVNLWSVSEAIPWLREIRDETDFAEDWFADRMLPSDLFPSLVSFRGWIDVLNPPRNMELLVTKAMNLALDRIEEPEISEIFIRLLQRQGDDLDSGPIGGFGDWGKRIAENQPLRLQIASALLQISAVNKPYDAWVFKRRYLQDEDFPWLLEATSQAPLELRPRFAMLVRQFTTPELAKLHWNILAEKLISTPEIAAQFGGLKPAELRSQLALQVREEARQRADQQRNLRKLQKARKKRPRAEMIEVALRGVEEGKLNGWVVLVEWLFVKEETDAGEEGNRFDPTTSPVWKRGTDALRVRIKAAARKYLLAWDEEIPRETNRSTYQADAAFLAAWLLREELQTSGKLQDAFARNCVLAVVWFHYHEDAAAQLTALIYPLNSVRCREAFLAKLEVNDATEPGSTMAPNPFLNIWDSTLTKLVTDFILETPRKFEMVRTLLESLAKVDPAAIIPIWRQLKKAYGSNRERFRDGMAASTSVVIRTVAAEAWPELYPFLRRDRRAAEQAILHITRHGRHSESKSRMPLSERQLADMYLLLANLYTPGAPEESWPDGPFEPTDRHNIAYYRDEFLDVLTRRGTRAARKELARIAEQSSQGRRIWILQRRLKAAEIWRRAAWQALDSVTFAEQARRSNGYWVASVDDLLLVVMESLERLQRKLDAGADGESLEFWEYQTEGKRRTNLRPRIETEIARKIAAYLRQDLGGNHSAIIRREAEIQWDERRTDIEVIAHGNNGGGLEEWTVTIEIKGCWHQKLRTAPKDQLIRRYLTGAGRTHGVYLVAWFRAQNGARRTKLNLSTRDAVDGEIKLLCRRAVQDEPRACIRAFVLDCRLR